MKRERADLLMRPWRVGGNGVDGGTGVVVDMMIRRLGESAVVLAIVPLSVGLLRLAVLVLRRGLLVLLLRLRVRAALRLVGIGVVCGLCPGLVVVVRVLRVAYDSWRAAGDGEGVGVDGLGHADFGRNVGGRGCGGDGGGVGRVAHEVYFSEAIGGP